MVYLMGYLVIGVAVLGVVLVQDYLKSYPRMSSGLTEAIYPERTTLRYRLINNVVVPMLTGAMLIIGWPVAGYVMVKDIIWDRANPRKKPFVIIEKHK